jgi:glycosyltransferase involved in cell wall biosynthesis
MQDLANINHAKTVSIVIPAKNEERRLPLCLESIRHLNYDPNLIDIIVVDNGSSDATIKVANEFNCKVLQDSEATVGKLRNIGAKLANGEVLCFVDADIIVDLNWLYFGIKHLSTKNVGCVTGHIAIPRKSTWVEKAWFQCRRPQNEIFFPKWASSMNMILLKSFFFEIGGFSDNLVSGEDVDLSIRICRAGMNIVYDEKVEVVHTGEAKSIIDFFKKERWRGYSDIDLLMGKPFYLRNLKNGVQPIFFSLCLIWTFSNFILGLSVFLPATATLLLPSLRCAMAISKNNNIKIIFHILLIWWIYYCARSLALVDNIWDRIKNTFVTLEEN